MNAQSSTSVLEQSTACGTSENGASTSDVGMQRSAGQQMRGKSRSPSRPYRRLQRSDEDIEAGMTGEGAIYFQGYVRAMFRPSCHDPLFCVFIPSLGCEAVLDNPAAAAAADADARVMHGDEVVVELCPRELWEVLEGVQEGHSSAERPDIGAQKLIYRYQWARDHLQELKGHFTSIPGVEIDEFCRSSTGFRDVIFHAKRGLQACLKLDASEYTHRTADRTSVFSIRVKPVSAQLVQAFQIVSGQFSSSLFFRNIPGNCPGDVLSIARELGRSKHVNGPIEAVLADDCPNTGFLYFDTLSSAIRFKNAINGDPTCKIEAKPVKLTFNTDTDAQSRSPSPTREVALEDKNLKPVCTFIKLSQRALSVGSKVVVGHFSTTSLGDVLLKPIEKNLRNMLFKLKNSESVKDVLSSALIACAFDGWPDDQKYPAVIFKFVVGSLDSEGIELINVTTAAILGSSGVAIEPLQNGSVVASPFGPSITCEIQEQGFDRHDYMEEIPKEELSKRRDLRSELVMTIDPTSSRDFDDALHVNVCEDGFEVGVHIADVSYFVRPESRLDEEAQLRCATTYMQSFSVPMLPRELSENLCSLNPGVDRFAFSVIFKMNGDGSIDDDRIWFGRTLINNKCRMDYQTAQEIINGTVNAETGLPSKYPLMNCHGSSFCVTDVINSVRILNDLAINLQSKGKKTELGGESKMEFEKDPTTGLPIGFKWREKRMFSQILIEMFMVFANAAVARKLSGRMISVLRQHSALKTSSYDRVAKFCKDHDLPAPQVSWDRPPPDPERNPGTYNAQSLAEWKLKLEVLGLSANVVSALENLAGFPHRAMYCATGIYPRDFDFAHHGTGESFYTHFTSPIRRYPDVLVHRALQAVLDDTRPDLTGIDDQSSPAALLAKWSRILMRCNQKGADAKDAGREQDEVYKYVLVKQLQEKSCCPIQVACVVTSISPKLIKVYACCPLFKTIDVLSTDFCDGPVSMILSDQIEGSLKVIASDGRESFIRVLQELTAIVVPCRDKENWPCTRVQILWPNPELTIPIDWDQTPPL